MLNISNLINLVGAKVSSSSTSESKSTPEGFCNIISGNSLPFIIEFLIIVAIWIGVIVVAVKFNETAGGIAGLIIILAYVIFTVEEFKLGHISHAIIAIIPIILISLLIAATMVAENKKEKIRQSEIALIPERVNWYISVHGFTSPTAFANVIDHQPEFARALTVSYNNPAYTAQIAENTKRRNQKLDPLPVTEPAMISYGKYASSKYKETVLTYFMKELPDVMKQIYMFDYENLYDSMDNYKSFFLKADDQVDMIYFQQACVGLINEAIKNNIIERVGAKGNLFRSKIIPEEEGNVVEGETLEL